MKVEFGAWVLGIMSVVILTIGLWVIDLFVMPNSGLSLMEWWGVIMLMVTAYSGYQVYIEDN